MVLNVGRVAVEAPARSSVVFHRGWLDITRFLLSEASDVPPLSQVFLAVQDRLMAPEGSSLTPTLSAFTASDARVADAVNRLVALFTKNGKLLLLDRNRWTSQAEEMARVFLPFLKRGEPLSKVRASRQTPRKRGRRPVPSGHNSGEQAGPGRDPEEDQGQESSDQGSAVGTSGVGEDVPQTLGCQDAPQTRRFREDRAYRGEVIRRMLESGTPVQALAGVVPVLDLVREFYAGRAEEVMLRGSSSEEAPRLPIAHAGVRPVSPDEPLRLSTTKWSASRWYPDSGWRFFAKAHPLTLPGNSIMVPGRVPDLLFILDQSGSMEWRMKEPMGTYDLALTALFAIWRWLDRTGLGPWLRYAAIGFASSTRASERWYSYEERESVLRVLLLRPGGGTVLSTAALQALARAAKDRFWALVLTDGQVANAHEATAAFRDLVQQGNLVSLIQVGGETPFSKAMAANGADVHVVLEPSDLARLTLAAAERVWTG